MHHKTLFLSQILLLVNLVLRLFHPSLSSCLKLSIIGDTAKYLVLTLKRLCTFTLSLNLPKHAIHAECIKEMRELRRDLSEGEFTIHASLVPAILFSTYAWQADMLNSHDLFDQDRANCLKAARETSKLGGI